MLCINSYSNRAVVKLTFKMYVHTYSIDNIKIQILLSSCDYVHNYIQYVTYIRTYIVYIHTCVLSQVFIGIHPHFDGRLKQMLNTLNFIMCLCIQLLIFSQNLCHLHLDIRYVPRYNKLTCIFVST